jgi:hypothetical protein
MRRYIEAQFTKEQTESAFREYLRTNGSPDVPADEERLPGYLNPDGTLKDPGKMSLAEFEAAVHAGRLRMDGSPIPMGGPLVMPIQAGGVT